MAGEISGLRMCLPSSRPLGGLEPDLVFLLSFCCLTTAVGGQNMVKTQGGVLNLDFRGRWDFHFCAERKKTKKKKYENGRKTRNICNFNHL